MSEIEGGNLAAEDNVNPFTGRIEPSDAEDTASDINEDVLEQEGLENVNNTVVEEKEVEEPQGDARRMVINAIEDKFDKMDSGSMSADELYEFLKSNKEIELVADRSKRVKDRYRTFIKKYDSGELTPKSDPEQEREPVVVKKDKPSDGYVSKEDLVEILRDYDEKKQSEAMYKLLREEREQELEDFASSRGIKDNDYVNLKKNATTLFELNSGWTWKEALDATNRALFKTKGEPISVSGRSQKHDERIADDEDVDFSSSKMLVTPSEWGL